MSWIVALVLNGFFLSILFWVITKKPTWIEHVMELIRALRNFEFWVIIGLIQAFINAYIFSEWSFLFGFLAALFFDTVSGIYISWRKKEYSGKILRDKLMDKCTAYFTIILGYSATTKIVLTGTDTNIIQFIDLPFYSIFAAAEVFSIIRQWYQFKKYPALAKLMKHFKGFNDDTGEEEGS